MAKTDHESFNNKPKTATAKDGADVPKLPSSTTALAEEIPIAPAKVSDADRKAAETKVAGLQKEYDTVANDLRSGKYDAAKSAELLRRKGAITREIDAARRGA